MSGKRNAEKAFRNLDIKKKDNLSHIPGILGVTIGGSKTVEVPGREGYVYVRLRHNLSELIQAYNDQVSPVYGLPVLIKKDDLDPTRYIVAGRDLGVYQNWGTSPYLPRHGNTHSFYPGGGGDVVFVYDRQLMPLLVHPSGTAGACNVVIEPDVYYQDGVWKYGGGTGSADLCVLKPTDNTAKMILLYLDSATNPQLVAGSTFDATLTGTAQVLPFVPTLPTTSSVPLAWIRLVSGTSVVSWSNLYDARPWIVGDGVLTTGTSRHIIQDEGVNETDRPYLNFIGSSVFVEDNGGSNRTDVIISGSADLSYASLAEAQTGTSTTKLITPSTLPVVVRNGGFIRRDGTGADGDVRGDGAVDLQRDRGAVDQVASGNYSVIGGGTNNKNAGTYSSIGGGFTNRIDEGSYYGVISGGGYNLVSGSSYSSILGGGGNKIGGANYASVLGGSGGEITQSFGATLGRKANARIWGVFAKSSVEMSSGQPIYNQSMNITWAVSTPNATITEMWVDGASRRAALPTNTAWAFTIWVAARRIDVTGESAGYRFEGIISRDTTAASTALVAAVTKTVLGEDTVAWDCDVDADTTNGSLRIQVTGEAAKTIRWHSVGMISQAQ